MEGFSERVLAAAQPLAKEQEALQQQQARLRAKEDRLRKRLLQEAAQQGGSTRLINLLFSDQVGRVVEAELKLLKELRALASSPPALSEKQRNELGAALSLNAVHFRAALSGVAFPIQEKQRQIEVYALDYTFEQVERDKQA